MKQRSSEVLICALLGLRRTEECLPRLDLAERAEVLAEVERRIVAPLRAEQAADG